MSLLVAGLVALTGCSATPTDPSVPPDTTDAPAPAPVFASDDEAPAAATSAHAKYLEMSDRILIEGGINPDRINDVATPELAAIQLPDYEESRAKKLHTMGTTTFTNATLQSIRDPNNDGRGIVTVYLCSDISGTNVLNEQDVSIMPPKRPDRTPFVVAFDLSSQDPKTRVAASEIVWTGKGVCP